MPWIILGIVISYIIGSIPTAYLFVRGLKGIDIRQYGSGNVGATNALRLLGKGAGISVLILDILKGFLTVVILGSFVNSKASTIPGEILGFIFGFVCVCGHIWTVFLGFKGGKGLATTLGVLLGLAVKIQGLMIVLGSSILVWIVVFIAFRIVSVASILSAVALPLFALIFRQRNSLIFSSFVLSALVIWRHKSNLKRILQGKESRLSFKKSQL